MRERIGLGLHQWLRVNLSEWYADHNRVLDALWNELRVSVCEQLRISDGHPVAFAVAVSVDIDLGLGLHQRLRVNLSERYADHVRDRDALWNELRVGVRERMRVSDRLAVAVAVTVCVDVNLEQHHAVGNCVRERVILAVDHGLSELNAVAVDKRLWLGNALRVRLCVRVRLHVSFRKCVNVRHGVSLAVRLGDRLGLGLGLA